MNRYVMIHRLRWPAFLLLTGLMALLDQAGILSWGRSWPLYLILAGVLALAERATAGSQPPAAAYPVAGAYPGGHRGTSAGGIYQSRGLSGYRFFTAAGISAAAAWIFTAARIFAAAGWVCALKRVTRRPARLGRAKLSRDMPGRAIMLRLAI